MILIGRLLSPFVRRVQVTLNLLGLECERKPYGTATHVDEIGAVNPLRRIPALVLDAGDTCSGGLQRAAKSKRTGSVPPQHRRRHNPQGDRPGDSIRGPAAYDHAAAHDNHGANVQLHRPVV